MRAGSAAVRTLPSRKISRVIITGKISRAEKWLGAIFLLTLPLVNPWVRGDGVGYYAYARAPLIEHSLNFEKDWQEANTTFRMGRVDSQGRVLAEQYTATGHLNNHFTVGPALLWAPFLLAAHGGVLVVRAMGAHIPADGFSRPYRVAMALGTAVYGFLGLWLSFRVARRYSGEKWAAVSVLAIWFGSSLLVYMYFNPSWSHAHSAFSVALFVWYWDATRGKRSLGQWALLGLCAGLMVDVYYPNGLFLLLPLGESAADVANSLRGNMAKARGTMGRVLAGGALLLAAMLAGMAPTFITRKIVYGSPWAVGSYANSNWNWTSPRLWQVLFSADHGLFSWTPLLLLAVMGFVLVVRRERALGTYMLLTFVAYWYVIASYPYWDGLSSYGNRFFVSFTPLFVLGLAALLSATEEWLRRYGRRWAAFAPNAVLVALVLWNLGLVFQWGTHMIAVRGPVSWNEMAYNQVLVVPARIGRAAKEYLLRRSDVMGKIEGEDVRQIEDQRAGKKK